MPGCGGTHPLIKKAALVPASLAQPPRWAASSTTGFAAARPALCVSPSFLCRGCDHVLTCLSFALVP